jgi:hypothetical protein
MEKRSGYKFQWNLTSFGENLEVSFGEYEGGRLKLDGKFRENCQALKALLFQVSTSNKIVGALKGFVRGLLVTASGFVNHS